MNKPNEEKIEDIKIKDINNGYHVTEKLNGIPAAYILKKTLFGYKFIICSKNKIILKMNKHTEKYFYIATKYHIKDKLKNFFLFYFAKKYVAVQGEIIGEGIKNNPLDIKGQEFFVFNVIRDYEEFSPYDSLNCRLLCLPKVPFVGKLYTNRAIENFHFFFNKGDFSFSKEEKISKWKNIANINSDINPEKKVESLVFRSAILKGIKKSDRFIYNFKI